MAKQSAIDALENEMEGDVDRTEEPQFITRGEEPKLPMRHWRVKQHKVGEKRINATTIEDAIRAFNGTKTLYPRSVLTIDELDRNGNVLKTDAEMRKDADVAKEKYRQAAQKRWDREPQLVQQVAAAS